MLTYKALKKNARKFVSLTFELITERNRWKFDQKPYFR